MAEGKKIKGSDLIEPKFLTDAVNQAEKFLHVLTETKKVIIETNQITSKKLKGSAQGTSSADLKSANALMAESIKQRKLMVAAEEQQILAETKLAKAKQQVIDFEKKQLALAEKEKKAIEQQNSAYAQASKRLNDLRKQYKDLAIAGKSADITTHNLLMEIQKLDKELKKVDADVGQFNREVGNYKNAVKDALAETNLWTSGLDKLGAQQSEIIKNLSLITNQFKSVKEAEDAAAASAGKFSKILKASGIGLLIVAVGALASFFTSSREGALEFDIMMNRVKATIDVVIGSLAKVGKGLVGFGKAIKAVFSGDLDEASRLASEASDEISTAFDGNIEDIEKQIEGYDALTRKIFEYEDALRKMQIQLDDAKMNEEDFNEILADQTISLNRQKAALEGAIKSRLEQAKIQKNIADQEYEIAVQQAELKLRNNKLSEEEIGKLRSLGYEKFLSTNLTIKLSDQELDALQEKFRAQKEADDRLDDLSRQENERRRKIHQEEIIRQIELIRSKKLGADEEVKILTKQVNDEKFQLEEREKINNTLRTKQLEARAEEIKLLGEFGLTQQEVLDLINEKDQVKLANNLKLLNDTRLSVAQTDELAKVILEAQNQDLEYQEQLAKFEEERIKREQKILALQKEINIISEQAVLDEVVTIQAKRQKAIDDSNNAILNQYNVFNSKLSEQRKTASDEALAILEQEYKIRQDILDKQYELDQENIKNSVSDEKIREKELEKLRTTFDANRRKLQIEEMDKLNDFKTNEIEQLKKIELRKTEILVEQFQKVTEALDAELEKRQNLETEKANKSIEKTTSLLEKQRNLAERGLENTLAFQEEMLQKELLRQQDLEKKQAKEKEKLQLAEALLNAYNAELKVPNANPTTAAVKALGDVLLFKGLAAGLVQFAADGNDDVQGPGTTTSDSIPFMLSKHEGVVKASANIDNPGVVSALNSDTFDKMYMPRYDLSKETKNTAQNIHDSLLLNSNKEIINLLEDIRNKPVHQFDVDKFGNFIETIYQNGIKTVIKHKNKRSIG
jgi:hypothetical protein